MHNTTNYRSAAAAELQSKDTFYAFEESFVRVWTELGSQVMQASIEKAPANKRKKPFVKPASGR